MRIYLLLMTIVFGAGQITAQNDPAAEKLLKDVSQKFESYDNVTVDFVYELYNPDAGVKQETTGKVIFSGNKYRAEYMGITDIFDGKKRYVIVPENQEVNVMSVNDDEEVTPAKMFDFYKKGYRFKMDIKQPVGGRVIRYVKLFPVENNEIDYVLIGVDTKTKHIYKIIIVQNNKTRITVNIRKFTVNKPVSENLFKFDKSKYPDYFINELD